MKHVKLNGVWYRLAEDAEGQHYVYSSEPLRPPNAQVVQGDSTDFQLRPDLLQWSLTDWSGGEGRLKWTPDSPNEHYQLQNVDPFSRPGMLKLGYESYITQASGGGDFSVASLVLCVARGRVWALSTAADQHYYFGSGVWTGPAAAGGSCQSANAVAGDDSYLFYVNSSRVLKRFDGTTWATHNDQIPAGTTTSLGTLVIMGDYVYFLREQEGDLFELSYATANTTTAETALYEFTPGGPGTWETNMCAGDGRIYFYTATGAGTTIHEVVPTSAAGTGYGRILSVLKDIHAEAIWFQNGLIYLSVATGDYLTGSVGPDRQIYYIDPNGSYGTLGSVRGLVRSPSDHGIPPPSGVQGAGTYATNGVLGRSALSLPPTTEDADKDDVAGGIFEISSLTGGIAAVGLVPTSITAQPTGVGAGLVYLDGEYFLYDPTATKVVKWDTSVVSTATGYAISAQHDFNIASEKILESIEVSTEPIVGSEKVTIYYSIDGAAWVGQDVVTTGAGGSWSISTDASTKTFRELRIKVELTSSSFVTPVVKSVDVFARVNQRIKTWNLLLDCTDLSAGPGYTGALLMDNLKGLTPNTVIDFVDKYQSHNENENGDQYDVVVDSVQIQATQPGEGYALVRLIEVT